ncbi:hypothetical protein BY996DRAFT_6524848 [Phakopsora pachyrhizi]|nr:hypothetical protein BY996DRAFT_6524848 [Phakopsora pachyrhizi]
MKLIHWQNLQTVGLDRALRECFNLAPSPLDEFISPRLKLEQFKSLITDDEDKNAFVEYCPEYL